MPNKEITATAKKAIVEPKIPKHPKSRALNVGPITDHNIHMERANFDIRLKIVKRVKNGQKQLKTINKSLRAGPI